MFLWSCMDNNEFYSDSAFDGVDVINTGEAKELFLYDDMLFVGTEDKGIYIYKITDENQGGTPLSNGEFLETLYENEQWGQGKNIKSLYYDSNTQLYSYYGNYSTNTDI